MNFAAKISFAIVLASLAWPSAARAAQPPAPERSVVVPTAYRVAMPANRLLDIAAQEALYNWGYRIGGPKGLWRFDEDAAILSPRRLEIPDAAPPRRLELGLLRAPGGAFSIRIYGESGEAPNPDVARLAEFVKKALAAAPAAPPDMRDLSLFAYSLSHVGSDRALATLKALGYSAIEHTAADGDNPYEKIYTAKVDGKSELPVIIKMIDSPKTSLLDKAPVDPFKRGKIEDTTVFGYGSGAAVPDIGGLYLHHPTSSDPLQRLLIVYDPYDEAALDRLLRIIQEEIDVPARQALIEALVLEVRTDDLKSLGAQYQIRSERLGFDFPIVDKDGESIAGTAGSVAGAFYNNAHVVENDLFRAALNALIRDGRAEILSNPSVLVMDDRHARVQIGQQRPVTRKFVRNEGTDFDVAYFPVGIVLNIKPRISEDEKTVSMQVETIVSAVDSRSEQEQDIGSALAAPIVDSRQVQTFVRVSDNTPFIIGGLIQKAETVRNDRIPVLGRIPFIGPVLFGSVDKIKEDREVIVVLTPHIVPKSQQDFSPIIPKDSPKFDIKDAELFRNTYRLRAKDVFDLTFVSGSAALSQLRARLSDAVDRQPGLARDPEIAGVLRGRIPGEEVSVWKMLYEVIEEQGLQTQVDRDRILYFVNDPAAPDGNGYTVRFLRSDLDFLNPKRAKRSGGEPFPAAIALTYAPDKQISPAEPFDRPTATVSKLDGQIDDYDALLQRWNRPENQDAPPRNSIIIHSEQDLNDLIVCLLLKEVIDLNEESGLDLENFKVGRTLVMPSESVGAKKFYVIDRRVAEYFYKVRYYYSVFEQEFAAQSRSLVEKIR